jgi:pilus assembly protein Flp/PilA
MIEAYKTARALIADRKGVTALEYGLIASLIAVAIIGAITTLGTTLSGLFSGIAGKIVAP